MSAHELETMMRPLVALDNRTARQKLSERFVDVLHRDFEIYGAEAVSTVRVTSPDKYLKLIADLVPKDFNLQHDASDAFVNIWQNMSAHNALVIEHDMSEGMDNNDGQ